MPNQPLMEAFRGSERMDLHTSMLLGDFTETTIRVAVSLFWSCPVSELAERGIQVERVMTDN